MGRPPAAAVPTAEELSSETFARRTLNVALTARFQAFVDGFVRRKDATPAGTVECRGDACLWSFSEPERDRQALVGELEAALAGAGWAIGALTFENTTDGALVQRALLLQLSPPGSISAPRTP